MQSPREEQRTTSDVAEESARLSGLPTELLIAILEYLTDDSNIISLACVCRRLNDVSLSYHLNPRLNSRAVSFGQFCLPYSFFRKLRPCFGTKPNFSLCICFFTDDFAKEIREVVRYLDSTVNPPDVHVDLSNISPSIVQSIPPADLDGFLRDLWQLNCRNLIPFLCLQQDWEVESVPCVGFCPPPLTSLDTVTLYPQPKHLVDWLVLSMNQSLVRRVVVCDSMSVLAQLTLPHLRTLDLQNGSISTNDLYKFLLRTFIENILISDAKLMASTENIHIQLLPQLSYISAPPDILTLFSPQLLAAVRSIRLEADLSSMDATQCVHNHQQAFLFISQLPNAYKLCVCLGELISTGALWADFAFPNSHERAEQRLANITDLSINDLVSIPAPQIAEAVARFPSVQNLSMLVPYSWPCLEEIAAACPSLIKISTVGKIYDCVSRSTN